MVPFPPDLDFVHHPAIEKWMQDQYSRPGRRTALVGKSGLRKSQLAIKFAHRIHADRPGTSVFWVHGNSRVTFKESYRALANVLALPRRHDPEVEVLVLVRDSLQRDDASPWLMVMDNADNTGVFFLDKGHDDISQDPPASNLPKSINGKILVTSHSLNAAKKLVGNSRAIQRIPIMEEDQAVELLRKRFEGETDEAAAIDLVRAFDCTPLAVNKAAAFINRRSPRVTITSYLDEFRNGEKRKDSLLCSDKGDLGRQYGTRRERSRSADLLSLMSQFEAHSILESMLHSYDDVTASDEGNVEVLVSPSILD